MKQTRQRNHSGECTIELCTGSYHARDYCFKHYLRFIRYGNAYIVSRELHGYGHKSEYNTWLNMKARCTNKNSPMYKNYGGRGITICEDWVNSFSTFIKDMGDKPSPKHSLDRINNEGNYEPSNCRWATAIEQANNRRPRSVFRA
jgi:hypothetical protein